MAIVDPTIGGSGLAAVHIGVDVGQKQDPTAIVIAELSERPSGRLRHIQAHTDSAGYHQGYSEPIMETVYTVRMMQRLALGTVYPDVAARVAEIACSAHLFGRDRLLLIDETGVGLPVYELIAAEVDARPQGRERVRMRPVMFTYGDRYERYRHGEAGSRLGKAYLVSRLQALLQTDRIHIPEEHPEAPAMLTEIKNYEIRVDQNAHDTYGAFKVGTHDDLVTALGLAVLDDPRDYRITLGPRMF